MRSIVLSSLFFVGTILSTTLEQSKPILTVQLTNSYPYSYSATTQLKYSTSTTNFNLLLDTRSMYTTIFDSGCKTCTNKNRYVRPRDRMPMYDESLNQYIKNLDATSVFLDLGRYAVTGGTLISNEFNFAIVNEQTNMKTMNIQDGLLSLGRNTKEI